MHRHLGSVDLPRDDQGRSLACVHPRLQGADWRPLMGAIPCFSRLTAARFSATAPRAGCPCLSTRRLMPRKGIAASLTERERWPFPAVSARSLDRSVEGVLARGSVVDHLFDGGPIRGDQNFRSVVAGLLFSGQPGLPPRKRKVKPSGVVADQAGATAGAGFKHAGVGADTRPVLRSAVLPFTAVLRARLSARTCAAGIWACTRLGRVTPSAAAPLRAARSVKGRNRCIVGNTLQGHRC